MNSNGYQTGNSSQGYQQQQMVIPSRSAQNMTAQTAMANYSQSKNYHKKNASINSNKHSQGSAVNSPQMAGRHTVQGLPSKT